MSTSVDVEDGESLDDIQVGEEGHLYDSLGTRSSIAQLFSSQAPSQTYLQPQHSHCCSSRQHASHRSIGSSRFGHRRHRKRRHRSHSQCAKATDELAFSKLKLKIIILFCLNGILAIAFVLTHPKISPFYKDEIPDGMNLCVRCANLRNKVGHANGLVEQLQVPGNNKYCCFKTIDQLLNLVEWYAYSYTKQEAKKIKDRFPIVNNTRYPSVEAAAAHMFVSIEGGQLKFVATGMDSFDSVTVGSNVFSQPNKAKLQIEEAGYYFLYSRLVFSKTGFSHKIWCRDRPDSEPVTIMEEKLSSPEPGRIVSLLHGIRRLDAYSTLTLDASVNLITGSGRGNYFGLYKISKV